MAANIQTPVNNPLAGANGKANSNVHSGESSTPNEPATNGHSSSETVRFPNGNTYNENAVSRMETRKSTSSIHTSQTFSTDQQVTVLRQTVIQTRNKLISEISHVDESFIESMSIESFLEYVEFERLVHMPRRGSRFDKVLKWAEFFALQISGYDQAVHPFVPDSKSAAKMIWAASRILIEVFTPLLIPPI
jgi:hypothetical protein